MKTVKIQANCKYPRPLRGTVQAVIAQQSFQYVWPLRECIDSWYLAIGTMVVVITIQPVGRRGYGQRTLQPQHNVRFNPTMTFYARYAGNP